ncbi:response regulator transcription factor [Gorillibacterium timonense]|uniref:response regulator transcription factor n=1 Tax=Gorillibacterium timonense TaxID=1689269 RepID=UPI0009E8B689|nr:response regulator transcription factor [Gorillibacterium timonense]
MEAENKVKLALVEDQELIRKSLRIVLDMEPDFQVSWLAGDGCEALELCAKECPDLILMDIQMPRMDGVEATRRIKAEWPTVKVIILTTFQEVNLVVDALHAGAEGYLLKAMDPRDLASGIRHVCRGETLIPQHMAKEIFTRPLQPPAESVASVPSAASGSFLAGGIEEYGLSEREQQVLKGLSDGLSNKEIAAKLFISEGTARNYISSVYAKMDVKNRAEAARRAAESSWFRDSRHDNRH